MSKEPKQQGEAEGRGSSWTNGRQLGAKTVTIGLVVAILCGPVALATAVRASLADPTPAAAAAGTDGLTPDQQAAGAYGLAYVVAWLGASRDQPGDLGTYIDVTSGSGLSDTAWEYRDAAVVSVATVEASPSILSVVIAANVRQMAPSATGDTVEDIWPRRYFQVAVQVGDGAARAIGLPAPVAAPAQGEPVTLVYTTDVPTNDPAAAAVMAFLGAYLAGSGDISRYTTPGETINPISPAPYVLVDVTGVRADEKPSEAPSDGEVLRVLATAALSNELDQKITATYALTLTARAGRWEVTAIDLAPQEAVPTGPTVSSTPPSSDDE